MPTTASQTLQPGRAPRPRRVRSPTDAGVFVPDFDTDTVTRIDPASNAIVATIRLAAGAAPVGIAATPGAIWVADHHGQSISRIDPTTNTVVATIPIGGLSPGSTAGPSMLAVGAGSLWIGYPATGSVVRLDPQTDTVIATIPVGAGNCVAELAADDAHVWATSAGCGAALTRIDPSRNQATIPDPQPPAQQTTGAAIVDANLYLVVVSPNPSLLRIDQTTQSRTPDHRDVTLNLRSSPATALSPPTAFGPASCPTTPLEGDPFAGPIIVAPQAPSQRLITKTPPNESSSYLPGGDVTGQGPTERRST